MSFEVKKSQINPIPTKTEGKDPWKHRSKGMVCSTCMFYVVKASTNQVGVELGRCRRSNPTMKGYPAVFPTDWCGEHRLDQEKLLLG